jgi:hypothetical protein
MTAQQFNILNEDIQHKYLLIRGECIASRETEEHCILLFQIDSFYVEVYFDNECNEIIHSRTFESIDELQPYFEQAEIHYPVQKDGKL